MEKNRSLSWCIVNVQNVWTMFKFQHSKLVQMIRAIWNSLKYKCRILQLNFNDSNIDGSFTVADSVPQPTGRGHLILVRIRRRRRRCDTFLSTQYLVTSGWILTKFSWMYHLDITKNWLDFGNLDLIFKVTAVEKYICKFTVGGRLRLFSLKTPLLVRTFLRP